MANVPETISYDAGIYQIETTDPVLGGPNGIANAQAKALANRTAFLKQQIDQLNSGQLTPSWIASQAYVQEQLQKLDAKQSVRAATTSNITLSGVQTIDGVVLTVGDRVLVKDQAAAAQNGIYLVAAQSWTRATDADDGAKLSSGARVSVDDGTINAGKVWYLATSGAISVGTTALSFSDEHPDATETLRGTVRIGTQNEIDLASDDKIVPSAKKLSNHYRRGNVIGPVSQLSGTPTGSIIESGSNANGKYVKFADGTLIQWLVPYAYTGSIAVAAVGNFGAKVLPSQFIDTKYVPLVSTSGMASYATAGVKVSIEQKSTYQIGNVVIGNASSGVVDLSTFEINIALVGRWY